MPRRRTVALSPPSPSKSSSSSSSRSGENSSGMAEVTSMRRSVLLCVAVSLIFLDSVEARPGLKLRTCGQNLAHRIGEICGGKYNSPAHSMGHHRVRRGIVDECCKNRCTDFEIAQYCNMGQIDHEESDESPEAPPEVFPAHLAHFLGDFNPEVKDTASEKPEAPKSKVVVGRVPQDFVKPWSYSAH